MAIISRDRRLLFIMAPRTGCTAVGIVLRNELGGEFLPAQEVKAASAETLVRRKHTTLQQLMAHGLLTPDERRGLLVFSAVRNPFDSLVSLYVKNAATYQEQLDDPDSWVHGRESKLENLQFCATHTFDEWIEHVYHPRLRDRIRGLTARPARFAHPIGSDMVMRFERLQHDFDGVLARAGIPGSHPIPRTNTTRERRPDYRDYYSPRSRALVEAAFADDLERYGYAF